MNRQQRRAHAADQRHGSGSAFIGCRHADFARAVCAMEQAQQPGTAELLRAVAAGRIALLCVEGRTATLPVAKIKGSSRPVVLVIGDDDYRSTGPTGWTCLSALAELAPAAVIHGAGATAETYREAIAAAQIFGTAVLIETDAAHADEWAAAFPGRPRLKIVPRDGAHPIVPPVERSH